MGINDEDKTREELLLEVRTLRRRLEALKSPRRESYLASYAVLNHLLEGCQVIGHDWTYLYLNDVAVRHAQQSREQLLRKTVMECYPGIEHTAVFAAIRQCMESRVGRKMENEFVYPDGSSGRFLLSIEPIPEGVFVFSIELTEQKRNSLP